MSNKTDLQEAWGSAAYLLRLKEDAERKYEEAYKKADQLERKLREAAARKNVTLEQFLEITDV